MSIVFLTLLIILFINSFAFILHKIKKSKLEKKQIDRRNRFMENYYYTIFRNLLILSFIIICIFTINISNFNLSTNIFYICIDTSFVLLINDTWFYWLHRLFHQVKYLRRHIHGEHHYSIEPLPLDYIYAHPLEIVFGIVGMIIPLYLKSINLYSYLFASILRNIHEIEIHTNKNGRSIIPFFNSPLKHYIHHASSRNCNYASMFPFWDNLFNTNYFEIS